MKWSHPSPDAVPNKMDTVTAVVCRSHCSIGIWWRCVNEPCVSAHRATFGSGRLFDSTQVVAQTISLRIKHLLERWWLCVGLPHKLQHKPLTYLHIPHAKPHVRSRKKSYDRPRVISNFPKYTHQKYKETVTQLQLTVKLQLMDNWNPL